MKILILVLIILLNLNTKIIASEISGFAVVTDGDTIKISNNKIARVKDIINLTILIIIFDFII